MMGNLPRLLSARRGRGAHIQHFEQEIAIVGSQAHGRFDAQHVADGAA